MNILKPQEKENLFHEITNLAMSGNSGIAIVKLSKKVNFTDGLEKLNQDLISAELEARRKIRKLLVDYMDAHEQKTALNS